MMTKKCLKSISKKNILGYFRNCHMITKIFKIALEMTEIKCRIYPEISI